MLDVLKLSDLRYFPFFLRYFSSYIPHPVSVVTANGSCVVYAKARTNQAISLRPPHIM